VFVCLSVVCLFVRLCISKTTCPNFTKFSLHITRGRGLVILRQQCDTLCTSGIVNDVKFSRLMDGTGPNHRQRLWLFFQFTRWYYPVVGRQATSFGRDRYMAGPERSLPCPTAFCHLAATFGCEPIIWRLGFAWIYLVLLIVGHHTLLIFTGRVHTTNKQCVRTLKLVSSVSRYNPVRQTCSVHSPRMSKT